jgi:NAD(P)-dependent dehydrogenase (short-subunit alcohol dehydrogenase family)/uncharacterized protein YndB with AHSA1/START domain
MATAELAGRIALVTGGGRGIGRAIAIALAQAGAHVAVLARSRGELEETVRLIATGSGRACAVAADVVDECAVERAVSAVEAEFGLIDVLVSNAGTIGPIAPFAETASDAWWHSVEVNLKGPMLMSRRVLPGMIARGEGRIINLVTGVAPFAYFSGYCAGKAALIRFSECLAAEARPHGVAVFPMGPGTVRTAMSEYSLNSPEGRQWLPWFKRIFDDGLDLPPERPAELAVRLASGRYDALSGLTLNPRDDLDEILARLEEVERDKLYSMRLRALPSPDASRIEAVRDAGAQALPSLPELRVERHLAAARERVFALWTDADAWTRWFLPPEGAEWIETPMVDARPGGRASIAVRQRGLDYCLSAIFTKIDAPARLAFRWTWGPDFPDGGPGDTDAVVEFCPDGTGTRVTLRQRGFTESALWAAHERGWNRCLEGMARLLAETAG